MPDINYERGLRLWAQEKGYDLIEFAATLNMSLLDASLILSGKGKLSEEDLNEIAIRLRPQEIISIQKFGAPFSDIVYQLLLQICLKGVARSPGLYPEWEKFLQGIDPEGLLLSKYIVPRDPHPVTILEPAECPAS